MVNPLGKTDESRKWPDSREEAQQNELIPVFFRNTLYFVNLSCTVFFSLRTIFPHFNHVK